MPTASAIEATSPWGRRASAQAMIGSAGRLRESRLADRSIMQTPRDARRPPPIFVVPVDGTQRILATMLRGTAEPLRRQR